LQTDLSFPYFCFSTRLTRKTSMAAVPGITRLLLGDALVGEHERLRERVAQFFDRLEAQVRQILRDGELRDEARVAIPASSAARTLVAVIEGSMARFVRSRFRQPPTEDLEVLCTALIGALLRAPAGVD